MKRAEGHCGKLLAARDPPPGVENPTGLCEEADEDGHPFLHLKIGLGVVGSPHTCTRLRCLFDHLRTCLCISDTTHVRTRERGQRREVAVAAGRSYWCRH